MDKNLERFRYGTKEIIMTLVGVVVIVLDGWMVTNLLAGDFRYGAVFEWISPGVLVVAVAAVFFGPVTGMLCGLGGPLLIGIMLHGGDINYTEVAISGIYGFILGLYFGKLHYNPAFVNVKTIIDFNAIQIGLGILCKIFMAPLLLFLAEDENLYDSVGSGVKAVIGNTILIGTVCSLIMVIVYLILKRKYAASELERHVQV